jgi:hypothetical protein
MLQFDKTRIAVRERSYIDLLDLALRVSRVYAWPLLLAFAAGIVPMMLLNGWLLADFAERDFAFGFQVSFPIEYVLLMVLLIFLEVPLATAPATLYLGQAVFTERPNAREIARQFRQAIPQLLLYRVLFRILFAGAPYLNEVILLESNPLRKKNSPRGESTLSRSRVLHRDASTDTVARAFAVLMVGGTLFASIWLSIFFLRGVLLGLWGVLDFYQGLAFALQNGRLNWEFFRPMCILLFPLALWTVVGYFAVVRFLSYLDLRIRREGWEVELVMRAERARLARHSR